MKRLTAEIDVEVTIRVCNANDRSKPTKWRRMVPEHAPHRAVSYREGPQNEPTLPPAPPGAFTQLERLKGRLLCYLRDEMSELEKVCGALAVRDSPESFPMPVSSLAC